MQNISDFGPNWDIMINIRQVQAHQLKKKAYYKKFPSQMYCYKSEKESHNLLNNTISFLISALGKLAI